MKNRGKILNDLKKCLFNSCDSCDYEAICARGENGSEVLFDTVVELVESTHSAGMEEAWELAQKVYRGDYAGGYSCEELADIFGDQAVHDEYLGTVHEVKAKIDAWEEAKKIGNEGWILCSDRLPDKDGEYLIQTEAGSSGVLGYAVGLGWNCSRHYDGTVNTEHEIKDIVAWRLLPPLYRG